MLDLEINYKFNVNDVLYFIYYNEIKKGIVDSINIDLTTEKIKKNKDYRFKVKRITYSLNLIGKKDEHDILFSSMDEEDLFRSTEELIKSWIDFNMFRANCLLVFNRSNSIPQWVLTAWFNPKKLIVLREFFKKSDGLGEIQESIFCHDGKFPIFLFINSSLYENNLKTEVIFS